MIPLYGFLQGDTIGLLVLAYSHETAEQVAHKLVQMAQTRVKNKGECQLFYQGEVVPAAVTMSSLGARALDRIDVRWRAHE